MFCFLKVNETHFRELIALVSSNVVLLPLSFQTTLWCNLNVIVMYARKYLGIACMLYQCHRMSSKFLEHCPTILLLVEVVTNYIIILSNMRYLHLQQARSSKSFVLLACRIAWCSNKDYSHGWIVDFTKTKEYFTGVIYQSSVWGQRDNQPPRRNAWKFRSKRIKTLWVNYYFKWAFTSLN